jgi:excisionase family DNA binding protein
MPDVREKSVNGPIRGAVKTYLTPTEAAQLIGVAVQTLAKWRSAGSTLPFIKVGGRKVMYALDDLVTWMNAQRVTNTSSASSVASSAL